MDTYDFDLYRGDTFVLDIALTDSSGAPFDAGTAQVAMLVVGDNGQTLRPGLATDGANVRVTFAAGLTAGMTWRRGRYDLQLTFGDTVITVLRGKIRLIEDITP